MVLLGVITILDLKPRRLVPPSFPVEAVPSRVPSYYYILVAKGSGVGVLKQTKQKTRRTRAARARAR